MAYSGTGGAPWPPTPDVQSHAAPPAGYPVAPITVSSGVVTTIPCPTQNGGPVPIPLHWVDVQNNSPYTLLVAQGTPLKQIAPFTEDLVEVLLVDNQTGLTITPQAGGGQVAPGSDSVVNATWYGTARPDGSFPTGLGSQGVSLVVGNQLFEGNVGVIPHGGGAGVWVPSLTTVFDVTGYASVRIAAIENGGLADVQMFVTWPGVAPFTPLRKFTIPAGDTCTVVLLNITDSVRLHFVCNDPANDATVGLLVSGVTTAEQMFIDDAGDGLVLKRSNTALAAGATTQVFVGGCYGGPAWLSFDLTQFPHFNLQLKGDTNGDGTYDQSLGIWTEASDPSGAIHENLLLPTCPLLLRLHNTDVAAHNYSGVLIEDSFRAG